MDQAAQELITRHNEQIRELIVRDIDQLEDKLNVKRQVSRKADEALDKVKGTLGMNQQHQSEGWGGFARHNAAPLLAVGLGGAVLARNLRGRVASGDNQSTTTQLVTDASWEPARTSDGSAVDSAKAKVSDVADTASAKAGEVADTARAKVDEAKAKVGDAKDAVVGSASSAKETVSTQAVHAKDVIIEHVPSRAQASRMATDHNQLLGLAALAAGAVAGTFVPRTRAEERRLAPVQAQVKEKASELVEEGVEKAKETADRAAGALSSAAETAKEEFADSGEDEPPAGSGSDLPDLTRPNRITGSRSSQPTINSSGGSTGSSGSAY